MVVVCLRKCVCVWGGGRRCGVRACMRACVSVCMRACVSKGGGLTGGWHSCLLNVCPRRRIALCKVHPPTAQCGDEQACGSAAPPAPPTLPCEHTQPPPPSPRAPSASQAPHPRQPLQACIPALADGQCKVQHPNAWPQCNPHPPEPGTKLSERTRQPAECVHGSHAVMPSSMPRTSMPSGLALV